MYAFYTAPWLEVFGVVVLGVLCTTGVLFRKKILAKMSLAKYVAGFGVCFFVFILLTPTMVEDLLDNEPRLVITPEAIACGKAAQETLAWHHVADIEFIKGVRSYRPVEAKLKLDNAYLAQLPLHDPKRSYPYVVCFISGLNESPYEIRRLMEARWQQARQAGVQETAAP
jgi:hypothetical protein